MKCPVLEQPPDWIRRPSKPFVHLHVPRDDVHATEYYDARARGLPHARTQFPVTQQSFHSCLYHAPRFHRGMGNPLVGVDTRVILTERNTERGGLVFQ